MDAEEKLVSFSLGNFDFHLVGCVSRFHKMIKKIPFFQFLYVNQTFAPAPDQIIKNLYDCYGSNGKLVLYYCKSQAWG